MIERKWKPENHRLEDAFFHVELYNLKFVYPAETDLFGKVVRTEDVLAKGHKAVVDINKCHVFATVTDKYKLVTNHWHPIHAKRTWMTPHKASLSVETGNYLKAI